MSVDQTLLALDPRKEGKPDRRVVIQLDRRNRALELLLNLSRGAASLVNTPKPDGKPDRPAGAAKCLSQQTITPPRLHNRLANLKFDGTVTYWPIQSVQS